MYNEKRKPSFENKKKKKNVGFYIALALCIVTVAGAAWTTYGNVTEYYSPTEQQSGSEELPAGNDVSGERYETSEEPEQISEQDSEQSSGQLSEESSESEADDTNGTEEQSSVLAEPVEGGEVIKQYSPDIPLFSKTTTDWRVHTGVDISAEEGTAVRSMTDGVVSAVKKSPMYGNIICIKHGSYDICYCGMSEKPVVIEGNNVKAGDTIGYAGTVPGELLDDAHIHIEVRLDGKTVDPETLKLSK